MVSPIRALHLSATLLYLCAGELILVGFVIAFSKEANVRETPRRLSPAPNLLLHIVTQWDAQGYVEILDEGYAYDPKGRSNVAYFPAYPLLGRAFAVTTGWSGYASAWAVAQMCLIATFGVFPSYLSARCVDSSDVRLVRPNTASIRVVLFALAAFALYPPCMFMWMAYSESLFFLVCIVTMLGILRGWRPLWIALLVCAATVTRPVGLALLAPLALYAWRRQSNQDRKVQTPAWSQQVKRLATLAMLLLIACGGILAYMAFQRHVFGTPLAFAQTQENWSIRPNVDWPTKALLLTSGEPIWSAYVPGAEGHWTRQEEGLHALLSLHFLDPLYFVAAVVLVYVGARKGWLSVYEVVLAVGLIVIPYVTKGYEMTMSSQARYTTVVFPIYIVFGQILSRVPWWVAVAYFAVSATFFVIYSAMWAAGHVVI
jgi:hypothetical protein